MSTEDDRLVFFWNLCVVVSNELMYLWLGTRLLLKTGNAECPLVDIDVLIFFFFLRVEINATLIRRQLAGRTCCRTHLLNCGLHKSRKHPATTWLYVLCVIAGEQI